MLKSVAMVELNKAFLKLGAKLGARVYKLHFSSFITIFIIICGSLMKLLVGLYIFELLSFHRDVNVYY